MDSHYQRPLWATEFPRYPVVLEKFNAFKDQDVVETQQNHLTKRIGKAHGYRAPFTYYPVSRDALFAITVLPNYKYSLTKGIPALANGLFALVGQLHALDKDVYMQLIFIRVGSMQAKIRTQYNSYVFTWDPVLKQWVEKDVDKSKPRNW